jgi:hypothetical protein
MKYFYLKIIICCALILIIVSCHEKISGKSEKDFKTSRQKVEKELNAKEKINLEKSFRVILLESMRLKWDESKKYKKQSFDDISLNLVDGLNYSSICDLAENILQDDKNRKIEKLTDEIKTLENKNQKLINIKKKLNLFKIESLQLNEKDWFGSMSPELEVEYKYIGKNNLKGSVEISLELINTKKKYTISLQGNVYGNEDHVLKNGQSLYSTVILEEEKERNPSIWNHLKYPIKNPSLSDYDLELKTYVSSVYLNGNKVIMPKIKTEDLEAEIKRLNSELEETLKSKGTLDELELTDK